MYGRQFPVSLLMGINSENLGSVVFEQLGPAWTGSFGAVGTRTLEVPIAQFLQFLRPADAFSPAAIKALMKAFDMAPASQRRANPQR